MRCGEDVWGRVAKCDDVWRVVYVVVHGMLCVAGHMLSGRTLVYVVGPVVWEEMCVV